MPPKIVIMVETPKEAAKKIVEELAGADFINEYFKRNWLKNKIEEVIKDRDAKIMQDVREQIGGTSD